MKQIESLMGWLIAFIISGLMLTGCTESQENRKEIRKGRNALRGRYQPGGYEGLCGNH